MVGGGEAGGEGVVGFWKEHGGVVMAEVGELDLTGIAAFFELSGGSADGGDGAGEEVACGSEYLDAFPPEQAETASGDDGVNAECEPEVRHDNEDREHDDDGSGIAEMPGDFGEIDEVFGDILGDEGGESRPTEQGGEGDYPINDVEVVEHEGLPWGEIYSGLWMIPEDERMSKAGARVKLENGSNRHASEDEFRRF